jgi:uncharacterized protein with HEPN domain
MRSESATAALRDIEHHIDLANGFVAELRYEEFRDDVRTVYAVTRCPGSFQKRRAVFRGK